MFLIVLREPCKIIRSKRWTFYPVGIFEEAANALQVVASFFNLSLQSGSSPEILLHDILLNRI